MRDTFLIDVLLKQIGGFNLSDSDTKQSAYLAEELFLAHYQKAGELTAGVVALLHHCADVYMVDDPAREEKRAVLDQLIYEMQHPSRPGDAPELLKLFKRGEEMQRGCTPPLHEMADFDPKWQRIEDVPVPQKQIMRYGHVLFLPEGVDICVLGDSHGDLASVSHIVDTLIGFRHLTDESRPYLVFLGDYVNNGLNSVGLLEYVLKLQQDYPHRVILLTGNHDNRETWLTAFKEFFFVHWHNYVVHPYTQVPPRHYGHVRLDLARTFGVAQGEKVYAAFARWGHALPYICFDPEKRFMMSHSLGKVEQELPLTLFDLAYGKQAEAERLGALGYEAWKKVRPTPHSAMVTNREMTPALMDAFHALGIERFFIGHTHYLSGGEYDGRYNIASSHMDSPDAGHYMYREYMVQSGKHGLPTGMACYVEWKYGDQEPKVHKVGCPA